MSQKYEELVTLLQELFQLDQCYPTVATQPETRAPIVFCAAATAKTGWLTRS